MSPLPPGFLARPFAHRGLHGEGRPENSLAAAEAAIAAGYGIECDVQLTADGEAVVFHDSELDRLTGHRGPVRGRTAAELARIALCGGGTIPTLADFLGCIAARTPLLLEVKDQDGAMGPDIGPLEDAVARACSGYGGPLVVMSFNPYSVAALAGFAPGMPRGLITSAFHEADWPDLPEPVRARLRGIPDYGRTGASFVSHEAADLAAPRLAELRTNGAAILCWTIRSAAEEAAARRHADQITFEHYRPAAPCAATPRPAPA